MHSRAVWNKAVCSVVKEYQMLTITNEDAREAWALRAGAELWKAVVAEAGNPAEDTQKALFAVRAALDCARRLRCCSPKITAEERHALSAECDCAAEAQVLALRAWGRGRGLHWGEEWGMQWGETLVSENGVSPRPADPVICGQRRQ